MRMDLPHPLTSTILASTSPSPRPNLTDDDIEAVIQSATSSSVNDGGRPLRDTRTQLFVGNLPYRIRWQDLKDLFRKAGTVLRTDVSLGPDNRSRGYGTVLLATAEDAGRAIDMFNGYTWQTRVLEVRPDRLPPDFDISNPTAGFPGPSAPSGPAVSSLPANMGPHYYAMSSSMGPPIYQTSATSISSSLDVLDYNSLIGLDPNAIIGRNLFVGNLPFHCQWQDLKDLFRQAGTVLRADVAVGPDGRSKGFGTVVFATEFDMESAIRMFNGYEYHGRMLKVHRERFSNATSSSASVPSSPDPSHQHAFHQPNSAPTYIPMPTGYPLDRVPGSVLVPDPPFDLYPHTPSMSPASLHHPSQSQSFPPPPPLSQPTLSMNGTQPHSSAPSSSSSQSSMSMPSTDSLLPNISSSALSSRGPTSPRPSTSKSTSSSTRPTAHPGPIVLPPPMPVFPLPAPHTHPHGMPHAHPLSPLHYPHSHPHSPAQTPHHQQPPYAHVMPMTPHGLPPITPSMPPFTFLQHAPTPLAAAGGAGVGGGSATTTFSPGAFWGRPRAGSVNPFINPAVGSPVHAGSPNGGSSVAIPSPMAGALGPRMDGYFPPMEPEGYFPPVENDFAVVHRTSTATATAPDSRHDQNGSSDPSPTESTSDVPQERHQESDFRESSRRAGDGDGKRRAQSSQGARRPDPAHGSKGPQDHWLDSSGAIHRTQSTAPYVKPFDFPGGHIARATSDPTHESENHGSGRGDDPRRIEM